MATNNSAVTYVVLAPEVLDKFNVCEVPVKEAGAADKAATGANRAAGEALYKAGATYLLLDPGTVNKHGRKTPDHGCRDLMEKVHRWIEAGQGTLELLAKDRKTLSGDELAAYNAATSARSSTYDKIRTVVWNLQAEAAREALAKAEGERVKAEAAAKGAKGAAAKQKAADVLEAATKARNEAHVAHETLVGQLAGTAKAKGAQTPAAPAAPAKVDPVEVARASITMASTSLHAAMKALGDATGAVDAATYDALVAEEVIVREALARMLGHLTPKAAPKA